MKCTPQYNQETRQLMEKRGELTRIAKGVESGNFGLAIRAKANDLIDAGHTAVDVLDQTHAYINQYAPHSKEEVSNAITGHGRPVPTKKEAFNQRASIKGELRDLAQLPDEAYNRARTTALNKRLAEYERRIAANDFSPFTKPTLHQLSEANRQSMLKVQGAKNAFTDAQLRDEFKKQGIGEKTGNFLLGLQRMMLFSHITTFGKLTSAALQRIVFNPIDDLAGSALNAIPGYKSAISGGAPTEGQGFSPSAYASGLGHVFSKETGQDMRRMMVEGQAGMDVLYGLHHRSPGQFGYLEWAARMHGVIKTPAKQFAFYESMTKQIAHERDQMLSKGMDPAAVDIALQRPENLAVMQAKALVKGKRAILMQDNAFSDWFQGTLRQLSAKGGTLGKIASFSAHGLMPVVKIPSNFMVEVGSYTGGALPALKTIVSTGISKLTPEQKDYISRNMKKQTVGLGLLALGFLGPETGIQAGGYYDKKHQPKKGDPDFGGMQLFGLNVPRFLVHSPQLEVMQIGATLRRYVDSRQRSDTPAHAAFATLGGIASEVPLFSTAGNVNRAVGSPKAASVFAGREATSFVEPGFIQDIAKWTDPAKTRRPKGFSDAMKLGIPGLREQVPQH